MTLAIQPLYLHPELRPAVARLIYDEFWTDRAGASPAWMEGRLREAGDHARLPLSFVALADGAMVGTINLIDIVYLGTDGPGFYRRLGAVVHEPVSPTFCIMRFDGLRARCGN